MTDKKYTDEEVVKALEDYIKENEFEYFHSNMMGEYPLIRKSIDLIKRQKAELSALYKIMNKQDEEISELNKKVASRENLEESFLKTTTEFDKKLEKQVKLERREAIKEFAERLKEIIYTHENRVDVDGIILLTRIDNSIDNLVKEMTEVQE